MKNNLLKKKFWTTACLCLMVLVILIFFVHNGNFELYEKNIKVIYPNYLKVYDLYDTENEKSLSILFEEKDILTRLEKMNVDLNTHFDFFEIYHQPAVIYGEYDKGEQFVYGYETGEYFVNQSTIDFDIVTQVKAIQLGYNSLSQWNINEKVSSGRSFTQNDYIYNTNERLSVILGAEYDNCYDVGSEIEIEYLGEIFVLKVVGFLKKNSTISINDKVESLDRNIIMPFFEPTYGGNELFLKKYFAQKNWGYIGFEDKSEIDEVKKKLQRLSKDNNLDYGISDHSIM